MRGKSTQLYGKASLLSFATSNFLFEKLRGASVCESTVNADWWIRAAFDSMLCFFCAESVVADSKQINAMRVIVQADFIVEVLEFGANVRKLDYAEDFILMSHIN
jgi:hypothetical protein